MSIITLEDLEKQVNGTDVASLEKEVVQDPIEQTDNKKILPKDSLKNTEPGPEAQQEILETPVAETSEVSSNTPSDDDDAAFVAWAKMLYENEGYEEPFNEEEFRKKYGAGEGKKVDSKTLLSFNNDLIASKSKPQFASEEAERFNNYIAQGGNPKYIAKAIDELNEYNDVTSEELETNPYITENVVWNYYLEKYPGKTEEFIQNKINTLKEKELLIDEAKEAIEFLREHSAKKIEEHISSEKAKKQAEEQRVAAYWNDQQARITNASTLAGVQLDERTKQNFLKWHFSNGLINTMKNPEQALELAFIAWMGGAKGLEKTVNSKVTSDFKEKINKYKDSKTQVKSAEPVDIKKETDHLDMILNSTTRYKKI